MMVAFTKSELQVLIDALLSEGYQVIGPKLGEGAIIYGEIESLEQLPKGWIETQEAATYRLQRDDQERFFAYTVGPQSWKQYLHPPNLCLFKAKKTGKSFEFDETDRVTKRAFLGVKACELKAISVQDNVFLEQEFRDPWYQRRREATFLIGVNCSRAASTCFCVSMDSGPQIRNGDDLTLTELSDVFLAEARSPQAKELLRRVPSRAPSESELRQAESQATMAKAQMGRELQTEGLPELLKQNMDHPRWERVAERCLTCSNCTMVCPTCFCFTVNEVTDLTGQESQRVRSWDSCFTTDFTFTSGSSHRPSAMSRYRHWMTHKLATWHDQFDESGCVGCGRCITWCPVGIDITEEAAAIQASVGGDDV